MIFHFISSGALLIILGGYFIVLGASLMIYSVLAPSSLVHMVFFLVLMSLYSVPLSLYSVHMSLCSVLSSLYSVQCLYIRCFSYIQCPCHYIRSFQLYMWCFELVVFTEPRSHEGGGLGTVVGHLDSCTRIVSKHGINFEWTGLNIKTNAPNIEQLFPEVEVNSERYSTEPRSGEVNIFH